MGIEWLIFLAGLWLLAPIPLLIALLVSRHQLAQAREQLAEWQLLASVQEPVVAPTPNAHLASSADFSAPEALTAKPIPTASTLDAKTDQQWRPQVPTALETAVARLAGWPKWLAPFFVQNIGWFIGGFCLVAGAVFLVTNTSGFLNALVVWGNLSGSSALLIGAGYQLRRQRPALLLASNVLLILGLLFGTLAVAVAVRLFAASADAMSLLALSAALSALTLGAYAFATRLVTALLERSLPPAYPRYVLAVSIPQLAIPLAQLCPNWQLLAALHLLLLGILWGALRRFCREWVRHIFLDQRFSAYYAAGLLLYAAAVTGIHLTWVWPQPLPLGYGGVLLMLVCLLLFPADAALQEWVEKYPLLARTSLILYALSLTAIVMAAPSTLAMLVTLTLGCGLYAWITWRYLSWPPLYLLLASLGGLYGYAVLQWLPAAMHLLAALPGLLAMLGAAYWLQQRAPRIAQQMLGFFMLLLAALSAWSLFHSVPGMNAALTCSLAGMLGYAAQRWLKIVPAIRWSLSAEPWAMTLAALAVAYLPMWWAWEIQTAYGWLALASIYALCTVRSANAPPWRAGMLTMLIAALFVAALATLTRWPLLDGSWLPLLVISAALLFWMSISLYRRSLFYGALLISTALGAVIKYRYFPAPGSGSTQFLLVIIVWVALRVLHRLDAKYQATRAILNLPRTPTISSLVSIPLQQTQLFLWLLGLVLCGRLLLDDYHQFLALDTLILAGLSSFLLVKYAPLMGVLFCVLLLTMLIYWPACGVFLSLALYLGLLSLLLPRQIVALACIASFIISSLAFFTDTLGVSEQWLPLLLALWQWLLIVVWRSVQWRLSSRCA